MVKPILLLFVIFCTGSNAIAQKTGAEKKTVADSSIPAAGFKKTSSPGRKKTAARNNSPVPIQTTSMGRNNRPANAVEMEDAAKVSEIMKLDFTHMPPAVQSKINKNKLQGKQLLTGIEKIFTVEIKTCLTDGDLKRTLLFLKGKKGFISSELVSPGLVKIIVEPTFDSAELKDAMNAKEIQFNFINRSYSLKN